MLEFAGIADVAFISVSLIEAATRRIEDSGFSFRDGLIIETAIESGARRPWSEDLRDGRMFGELVIVNPFKAQSWLVC